MSSSNNQNSAPGNGGGGYGPGGSNGSGGDNGPGNNVPGYDPNRRWESYEEWLWRTENSNLPLVRNNPTLTSLNLPTNPNLPDTGRPVGLSPQMFNSLASFLGNNPRKAILLPLSEN